MTAEEWAEYLATGRARLEALRADLAAGVDEATAAHRHGFATRLDVERHVSAVIRRMESASPFRPEEGTPPCPTGT